MDMFSRQRTREIWEEALLRAWSIPYNFVYIDFERKETEEVYRSGFNDCLFTPEEMVLITGIEVEESQGDTPEDNSKPKEDKQEKESVLGRAKRRHAEGVVGRAKRLKAERVARSLK